MKCAKCGRSAHRFGQPFRPPCPYNGAVNAMLDIYLCELCHAYLTELIWDWFGVVWFTPDHWGDDMRNLFHLNKPDSIDPTK